MYLKQLEYILKIAEENNITHAAEKLFITQSALNQQLLKLEKELGTPLFYRSRTDWHPTPAGEIYLDAARRILMIKQEAYNRIYDTAGIRKGRISVGFTPGRGIAMFSHVYPGFHSIYPDIHVEPNELGVKKQLPLLLSGELDIGFMTLLKKQRIPELEYIEITSEELFLAVPYNKCILNKKLQTCSSSRTAHHICPLEAFKEEPFVLTHKTSTIRELTDSLFKEAGFEPQILFETSNNNTIIEMVRAGICCGIVPAYYAGQPDESITYFSLPSNPSWDLIAAHRKGLYISNAAKDFIALGAEYFTAFYHNYS